MGLNTHNLINYGGGGGNQLNAVAIPSNLVIPLPGDFLIYIICWQAGLPLGGYVPVQPTFFVSDDLGQRWQNLFDVFQPNGPGGAYNSQYSMSVWFCDNAKGGAFNITTTSTAVPLLQDQQGHGSLLDWRLDNRNQILNVSKVDASNTANPTLPAFAVGVNQLVVAAFWCPFTTPAPALVSATPGYTVINSFGTTTDYHDEYIVRPSIVAVQQPGIVVAAAEPQWLMAALGIDISPPAMNIRQIQMHDFTEMPIEE
jgi:hypothetical protein